MKIVSNKFPGQINELLSTKNPVTLEIEVYMPLSFLNSSRLDTITLSNLTGKEVHDMIESIPNHSFHRITTLVLMKVKHEGRPIEIQGYKFHNLKNLQIFSCDNLDVSTYSRLSKLEITDSNGIIRPRNFSITP
jgi:hypothetical protein